MVFEQTVFNIRLKFCLAVRLSGHKQRKLNDHVYSFGHVYSFFCLCPLGLTIKLNFRYIENGPLYKDIQRVAGCALNYLSGLYNVFNIFVLLKQKKEMIEVLMSESHRLKYNLFISLLTIFYYERLSSFSFLVGCNTSILSPSVIGSDCYKKMALYGGVIFPGYDGHIRIVIPQCGPIFFPFDGR